MASVARRRASIDRTIKSALAAGLQVVGVQVAPDGGYTVLTAGGHAVQPDDLEQWRARRDARKAAGSQ